MSSREEQADELREMLMRRAMAGRPWVRAWFIDSGDGTDPPESFLQRFADLPGRVRKVSEARIGEHNSVWDPDTGEEGYTLEATVVRWIDDRTAEASYSAWHMSESAGGSQGIARLSGGGWSF